MTFICMSEYFLPWSKRGKEREMFLSGCAFCYVATSFFFMLGNNSSTILYKGHCAVLTNRNLNSEVFIFTV